ncbi:unnamed protein product [Citrullus colocynthis]|uniref:Transmembrane protein n=1 Tax=Citrullus colocynthis TaxID=252529 RepID=A0ABP0YLZ4_9ROSI
MRQRGGDHPKQRKNLKVRFLVKKFNKERALLVKLAWWCVAVLFSHALFLSLSLSFLPSKIRSGSRTRINPRKRERTRRSSTAELNCRN